MMHWDFCILNLTNARFLLGQIDITQIDDSNQLETVLGETPCGTPSKVFQVTFVVSPGPVGNSVSSDGVPYGASV